MGVRIGSAMKISPWVTTTWEGSINGHGSAILRISTRWRRLRCPELLVFAGSLDWLVVPPPENMCKEMEEDEVKLETDRDNPKRNAIPENHPNWRPKDPVSLPNSYLFSCWRSLRCFRDRLRSWSPWTIRIAQLLSHLHIQVHPRDHWKHHPVDWIHPEDHSVKTSPFQIDHHCFVGIHLGSWKRCWPQWYVWTIWKEEKEKTR